MPASTNTAATVARSGLPRPGDPRRRDEDVSAVMDAILEAGGAAEDGPAAGARNPVW